MSRIESIDGFLSAEASSLIPPDDGCARCFRPTRDQDFIEWKDEYICPSCYDKIIDRPEDDNEE